MFIDTREISVSKLHSYLLGAVIPRPIALASTIDQEGNINLSPFSFFNCFGSNPPLLIFSPSRRARDNTTKHTYENVVQVPEAVIHIVSYSMVHQISLASSEYPKGVNEFTKAGFTQVASVRVKPPRVKEASVAFECRVVQVIPTGKEGGAGNLVICEVLSMYIKDEILDKDGRIDPVLLDAVARLGGDWYCRVSGDSLFKIPKPLEKLGIGFDQLPQHILKSKVLTGNDLGKLSSVERVPEDSQLDEQGTLALGRAQLQGEEAVHKLAQEYLEQGRVDQAWKILLSGL
jgi:flavin reductase (DIM6/NTAB) family NADH-FMN oxidoreductase RutF